MIRVVKSEAREVETDAILRSVSGNLESDTPFSRGLEILAGRDLSDRLQAMGDLPVGAAVITPGGELSGRFLIHVVLQSADEPVTPEGIRSALQNGLRRAEEWGLESLAVPPLGTGAGNLEAEEAAAVMIPLLSSHLAKGESLREVMILVGSGYEEDVFSRFLERLEGKEGETDG
ncbi:MAG: hypothetical protein HKO65_06145 [Gemmatimonadetes bacterium]|nr:macro domain-containing protein [Gemmatimonadota bacterium]NNM04667.1 hypothetical protein [Gemmatimonadota bacterium]